MLILDQKRNNEVPASSNTPYHEVLMERIDFTTTEENEEVTINISIPFSGHIVAGGAASNAIRVYLDGDSYYTYSYASYWNGELLLNSGTFPHVTNLPQIGHLSGSLPEDHCTSGSAFHFCYEFRGNVGNSFYN